MKYSSGLEDWLLKVAKGGNRAYLSFIARSCQIGSLVQDYFSQVVFSRRLDTWNDEGDEGLYITVVFVKSFQAFLLVCAEFNFSSRALLPLLSHP